MSKNDQIKHLVQTRGPESPQIAKLQLVGVQIGGGCEREDGLAQRGDEHFWAGAEIFFCWLRQLVFGTEKVYFKSNFTKIVDNLWYKKCTVHSNEAFGPASIF